MTEWWEKGYAAGRMVPVVGFPRPLHPPEASKHGEKSSVDGPDVVAYKRTVSRAGRWPWQPFDDSYCKDFAHGKPPGNVEESGVAGTQRQGKIDPVSGSIDEVTFNLLRSIRIPEGLPHAGQPAMDSNAQNLIAEAYAKFHPPPQAAGTVRGNALDLARAYLGYKENPPGSNCSTFGAWYGHDGQPWCAIFVTFCYECGTKGGSPAFVKGSRYAYCPYVVSDAEAGRYGLSITSSPAPGDLVVYDWDGGDYDHVGLFEDGDAAKWRAIEGNTSTSNQSNGGEVMRRDRTRSQMAKVAFVRVAEP